MINSMKDTLRRNIVKITDQSFTVTTVIATLIGIVSVFGLIGFVVYDSIGWLDWQFLTNSPSRFPEQAGIYPLIIGSFYLIILVALLALPVGVATAVHLEEYLKTNPLKKIIEINISNLAGVPSIVYGLLGLGIFVSWFNMGPGILLVGAFTMTLRILPVVIVSSQEAVKAVPDSLREASYALGATKWQMIKTVILPEAIPGIMTGMIISMATAIGETAPLIMIGVATAIFSPPSSIFDPFGALPLQIFAWSDFPKHEFQHGVNPAAIVVLLIALFLLMLTAVIIRNKFTRAK